MREFNYLMERRKAKEDNEIDNDRTYQAISILTAKHDICPI